MSSFLKNTLIRNNSQNRPAFKLDVACYFGMFKGCTGLKKAPELPVVKLANSCYSNMFSGCTGLTEAPELPAVELTESCYAHMFDSCSSLKYIKMMAEDISASGCLNKWVEGVSQNGTFVKNASATWDKNGDSGTFFFPAQYDIRMDAVFFCKLAYTLVVLQKFFNYPAFFFC